MTATEPNTAKDTKKKLHTKWWFWAIIVILALIVFSPKDSSNQSASNSKSDTTPPAAAKETALEPKPQEPSVPAEYKSALTKATSYATTMHMSKQAVYDQLVSEYGEKFKPEAAQYAIDNVKADWNANALAKAKSYQESMSMSPSAIRDQLVSPHGEKFTETEADYAIQHLNS